MNSSTESDFTSDSYPVTWIERYCNKIGNEFLCEIDNSYITDRFNLTGLNEEVEMFATAYKVITDKKILTISTEEDDKEIRRQTVLLYGLIHARFIMTGRGMELMHEKSTLGDFGTCPRILCDKQNLLPIGLSDDVGHSTVKVYCGRCNDIFEPKNNISAKLDGAFFGTGFPHMFYLSIPRLRPFNRKKEYEAKLYGFKIHPKALEHQILISNDYNNKLPKIEA